MKINSLLKEFSAINGKKRVLSTVLLCLFLSIAGAAHAQNATMNLKPGKTTVGKFIGEIEKQTDYLVVFSANDIKGDTEIEIEAPSATVSAYLNDLLSQALITYVFDNNYILLKSAAGVANRSGVVTGVVTDPKGEPLVGATVIVDGTTRGAITGADGTFELKARPRDMLTARYMGYTDNSVEVGEQPFVTIVLTEDSYRLEDVVVVGYGSVQAKQLTSAVSHVSSKDFSAIGTNNPMLQIQGKAASVSISNTAAADPNSSVSVQLRGVASRAAGMEPLYVVDGIVGANISNINPNDVESIDILKDGAASAIYGTRANNGVIIVTTKRGSSDGTTSVTYNGYASVDMINNKPQLLTANEFRNYRVPDGATDYGASTDWFDAVTKTGFTHSHAVTLTGGTQKFSYRGTVDARDASGVDLRSRRKEYGARIALNQGAPNDILKFSLTIAPRIVYSDNSDYSAIDIAMKSNPTWPIMDPTDPLLYSDFADGLPTGPNPVETLKLVESGTESKALDWNGSATLNLMELISPKASSNGVTFNTQVVLGQSIADNFDYYFMPSTFSSLRRSDIKGLASRGYSKRINSMLEWLANAGYSANGHTVSGVFGYSYTHEVSSGMNARNRNFASDAFKYNSLGSGDNEALIDPANVGMGSAKSDWKLAGFVGRVSYDYLQKYMVTASLRYEGSSKFGVNHKWGLFPAVSAGWRISDENFMTGAKSWLDDLKVRADFGITGNDQIDNYASLPLYGSTGWVYYNGQYIASLGPSGQPNPDLHWERGVNWNVGLDFALFDQRLSGSINYYNRTQKDLLGRMPAPTPPSITDFMLVNVGTMKNSGLELELRGVVVRNKNFNYEISLVAETMSNNFVSFSNDYYKGNDYDDTVGRLGLGDFGVTQYIQRLQEGQRVGSFYMYSYAGLNDNGQWLYWNRDNTQMVTNPTEEDRRFVGNGLPKFRLSMTHNLRYKNWDLSVSMRGAFGFDVFQTNQFAMSLKNAQKGYNVYRTAYSKYANIESGLGNPTDFWLTKGDYFKFDVVTLGYTKDFQNSRFIKGVRIYCTARNLFTIKGYEGLDPDVIPVNGIQPGYLGNTAFYPSTTQVLVGAQVKF